MVYYKYNKYLDQVNEMNQHLKILYKIIDDQIDGNQAHYFEKPEDLNRVTEAKEQIEEALATIPLLASSLRECLNSPDMNTDELEPETISAINSGLELLTRIKKQNIM